MIESDNRRGLDSLRELSDEDLARQAARGDEGAAKVLLERFEEPLYRYTVALLRDPDLAREATWSALFESARAVRANEHSEPVAPWLFQIALAAADVAGGRPDSQRVADDEAAARAAAASEPERDRLELLLVGLDELPARDRGSLLLRELVGLEYAGIATVTGARPAAARQAVFRARLGLQGNVEPPTVHCDEIRAAMSKAESGVRERRSIASHLEDCPLCAAFADELEQRGADLRTLFPAPAEPLVAELLPPLPPAPVQPAGRGGGRGGRGWRARGAVAPLQPGGGEGRGRRRRFGLVPALLGLLLAGAAVAAAIALNDNGGGKQGRAGAAGAGTTAAQAGGGSGGKAAGGSPSHGGKAKAHAKKPHGGAAKKPHAAAKKPHPPATSVPPSKPKGAAPSTPPNKSKGAAPGASGGGSGNGSAAGGSTGGSASGGGSGERAQRAAPCKAQADPAASPAQSAYSGRAGAAQAEVDPCAHGSTSAAGGLASTGLDLTPVIAAGLLLLGLGVGLRRLSTRG